MKNYIKFILAVVIIILVFLITGFLIKQKQIKDIENNIIRTESLFKDLKLPTEIKDNDILGSLTIPKISLDKAPIKEGIELNTLSEAIGHFPSTSLLSGNVGLASHNGGDKAPYFEKLNKLKEGDEIYYESIYGTIKYIVKTSVVIDETDFSYLEETDDNRLTLITCVRNQPTKRLCVQAIQSN